MGALEYWRTGQGLGNLTPPGSPHPEHEAFDSTLREWVGERSVVDFGCGTGRLAPLFDPRRYIGIDICAAAVDKAKELNVDHDFFAVDPDTPLILCGVMFAHTVLLHVSDDEIAGLIARFAKATRCVIVSEIMGRQWRRAGLPPVYNRDPVDYTVLFNSAGMQLNRFAMVPYNRYGGATLTMLEYVQ